MVAGAARLLADGGEFWAMKGTYPQAELAACTGARLLVAHRLRIPGEVGERHLLRLQKL